MSAAAVKVTVSDPVTGKVLGEQVIQNNYMIITAGNTHLAHTNAHANGTHICTIKAVGK